MPAFNIALTYSYRVEVPCEFTTEATDQLEAEGFAAASLEELVGRIPGASDLDISDIAVERGE
jgi:hypothetical protein